MYEIGKAVSTASYFEIDDVIDPADTRRWLTALLDTAPAPLPRHGQEAPEHRYLVSAGARSASRWSSPSRGVVQLVGRLRLRPGGRTAAVGRARSRTTPVVVALALATLHQQLPGVRRPPRRRSRGAVPAAGRRRRWACRSGCSSSSRRGRPAARGGDRGGRAGRGGGRSSAGPRSAPRRPRSRSRRRGWRPGALTMSAGVNGPPLVFVLQARHFRPDRFRATITHVLRRARHHQRGGVRGDGRVRRRCGLGRCVASLPGLAVGCSRRASCRSGATSTRSASAGWCSPSWPSPAITDDHHVA